MWRIPLVDLSAVITLRALFGSPSVSVMQHCDIPVTLIAEKKESERY